MGLTSYAKFYKWKNLIRFGVPMDRNDSMVIIAGIIILIIALIGIVYHEKTYESISPAEQKNSYRIEWTEYSDEIVSQGYVGKDGWSGNYTIDEGNNAIISDIEFKLEWSDDLNFHGFIFPWNWSDKIEMAVSIPEISFSDSKTGYEGITIEAKGNTPSSKIVKADNESEALKMAGEKTGKLNCKVSLSINPKPRFFDKGNDFTLHILYHYYKPTIQKIS